MLDNSHPVLHLTAGELRKGFFKPGARILTRVVSRSNNGMSKRIQCFVVTGDTVQNVGGYVAELTGKKLSEKDLSVTVRGTGFDAGESLVMSLSHALYDGTRYGAVKERGADRVLVHEEF